MPPQLRFQRLERVIPSWTRTSLPFFLRRFASPNKVSFFEAPRSVLGVVASCPPKLACCLPNFALITKFVYQIEVDREAFLVKGKVENLSSDGRLAYFDQDHCLGHIHQTVWCLLRGCLGGASIDPQDFYQLFCSSGFRLAETLLQLVRDYLICGFDLSISMGILDRSRYEIDADLYNGALGQ